MQSVVNFSNPILRCNVHLSVTFSELLLKTYKHLYQLRIYIKYSINLSIAGVWWAGGTLSRKHYLEPMHPLYSLSRKLLGNLKL